jgi:hypothetical protein
MTTVLINKSEEGVNLAIFNATGFLRNAHQMAVLQNEWHPRKSGQSLSVHYFALEFTID